MVQAMIYTLVFIVKYKLPPVCFVTGSKQSTVTQTIESIADNRLDMPEMCGLYSSDEVFSQYTVMSY